MGIIESYAVGSSLSSHLIIGSDSLLSVNSLSLYADNL